METASAGKMMTRSKRGTEHHPSSSHLSGSSTASASNRKPSACLITFSPVVESRMTAGKSSMQPPSAIPPPRTGTKSTKSSIGQTKETARPTKKLAREREAVTPLLGPTTIGRAVAAPAALRTPLAASRGNSASPQSSVSPIPFERATGLRVAVTPHVAKKVELMAPVKSRIYPSGPTHPRLRQPTPRSSRADNAPPKTPHSYSGSISQSRNKIPSKSGVESTNPIFEPRSEPGLECVVPSVVATTANQLMPENIPPANIPDRTAELEVDIQQLNEKVTDLTARLEAAGRENAAVRQLEDRCSAAVAQLENLSEENRHLQSQLQTRAQEHCHLQAEFDQLLQAHQALLEDGYSSQATIAQLSGQISEFSQRLTLAEMEKTTLLADQDSAVQRATELERCLLLAREEADAAKKEMAAMKKRHQTDCARAVDQMAELTKKLEAKEREADSWQTVTQLKQQDLRKAQSEVDAAKGLIEKHALCDSELKCQQMTIENLRSTISYHASAEKELRTALKEKDDKLREWHRRSTIWGQEKDTLKYQLDTLSEKDDAAGSADD